MTTAIEAMMNIGEAGSKGLQIMIKHLPSKKLHPWSKHKRRGGTEYVAGQTIAVVQGSVYPQMAVFVIHRTGQAFTDQHAAHKEAFEIQKRETGIGLARPDDTAPPKEEAA